MVFGLRTACERAGWTLLLGILGLSACTAAPSRLIEQQVPLSVDASRRDTSANASRWQVLLDHPFGRDGEVPLFLVQGSDKRVFVTTDQSIYLLSTDGRVLQRTDIPQATSGARTLITATSWDGQGLGAALRWGADEHLPAGSYLALTDGQGRFDPGSMVPLGARSSWTSSAWDGQAHLALFSEAQGEATYRVHLTQVQRSVAPTTRTMLDSIKAGTHLGGWITRGPGRAALCAVTPEGQVMVYRFEDQHAVASLQLPNPGRSATGPCLMATSGRTVLVVFSNKALPASAVDAGPLDRGLGFLTFDQKVAQLVGPHDQVLDDPLPLSQFLGTMDVLDLLWDGHRYLVLLNLAAYRGGRLVLAGFDETGAQLFLDQVIPLDYEPGLLIAGRIIATVSSYVLCYVTKRPWDEGVLHLAQIQ